jgi:hypothetical protein
MAEEEHTTLTEEIVGVGDEGALALLPLLPQPVMKSKAPARKTSHVSAQESATNFRLRNRFSVMLLPLPSSPITVLQGAALMSRGGCASIPI